MKTVTTVPTAPTAATTIPIIPIITSERGIGAGAGGIGAGSAGAGSRKDSGGRGAEHVVVSDGKGFSLLQQLRWL